MAPLSRRRCLIGLAALAGGKVLTSNRLAAQTSAAGTAIGLIDVHHHILPPVYLTEARDRIIAQGQGYLPSTVLEWTRERAIAELDANGVTTAIVSISTPGASFGNVPAARTLARRCNEYAARLVSDYRKRFGFFAVVPMPDIDGTLREIAYALDVLHADGIGLLTSYGDRWLGDPTYTKVFEELDRRTAVVYVHPTGPDCCRELIPRVPYVMTELPHDTTRAVTSLLFSGSFTRFRAIRFIFSHAGGTLPMLAGRIARQGLAVKELAEQVPAGVEVELKKLYYEIAGSANAPAMSALMKLVPSSQVLFGSDYPWGRINGTLSGLNSLGLSSADLRAIERENALALFSRLKA